MSILKRNYNPELDLERVLDFLRNTYLETETKNNYFPDRFENDKDNYPQGICLWEEINEVKNLKKVKIVGLTTPERKFIYFLQIHPKYHNLLGEMVEWIINHSKVVKNTFNTTQDLFIVCLEGNFTLEQVLSMKGFKKHSSYGYLRFRDVNKPVHDYNIPEGFSVRTMKGADEFELYAQAIRDTFGHGAWFDGKVVENLTNSSFYNKNLDLIVESPNGEIAAFCTFRMDPKSRITQLEPLGTVPKFRKMGLAKALLGEGFKRLRISSPTLLYIGGAADTPEANKLYDSVEFTDKTMLYLWKKEI